MEKMFLFILLTSFTMLSCKTIYTGQSNNQEAVDTEVEKSSNEKLDTANSDMLISRRVIKRPNLSKLKGLNDENGRIVIDLCIGRYGSVIYAKFNADESTIQSPEMIAKTESLAYKYRYQKDNTAEERQCGKLSFKIVGLD